MAAEQRFVLDHVALGVPSVAEAGRFLAGRLGGKPFEGGPGVGYRGGQWQFAAGERIELIEPAGEADGFLHRFLARHGAGVHHVTFKVPVLEDACERVRRIGFELVGVNTANPGWKEAFLHPKQAQGIVVQLAEAHPELDGTWGQGWEFPAPPETVPAPVRIEALHLAARSETAALRQWEEGLTGSCERDGGALRLRWPDSPIALVVHVDAGREPGPLHLELSGSPPDTLPTEPPPELGVRLVATQARERPT